MLRSLPLILATILLLGSCKKENSDPTLPPDQPNEVVVEPKLITLIEPTVSVACGACPLAHHKIEEIESVSASVTHISHYLFGPLHHPYSKYLSDKINKTFFTPLGHINRRHEEGSVVYYPVDMFDHIIGLEEAKSTSLEIIAETELSEQLVQVKISLATEAADLKGPLRLTVVLVEKEVVGDGPGYDQRNYGNDDPSHPYYQQGDWIQGFVHTNVIRAVLTPYEGDLVDLLEGSTSWTGQVNLEDLGKPADAYRIVAFANRDGEIVTPIINTAIAELSN